MVQGARKRRAKPVLIVQHAPHEHAAAVRRALETQGIPTLCAFPFRGEDYPKAKEIGGLISLGGPMGANDEKKHPWIKQECELLKAAVHEEMPVVGICLGGQMLAKALGGKVERNHLWEIGWFPVELSEEGKKDPIMGAAGEKPTVYHWHGDTFHLPKNATLLGQSQGCDRQAFRIGDQVYGFQFHPEADHQLVIEWLDVAGVAEEILDVQKVNGTQTVQDAETQRQHVIKGEIASLKIAAAIGGLFSKTDYVPIDCGYHDNLESWATLRSTLIIEFNGSDGRSQVLRGKIIDLLTIPAGEFVIFQEENKLLWPIRMDDIQRIGLSSSH